MLFEEDLLGLVQDRLSEILTGGVFYEEAPQDAAEPFGVLITVATPGAREVGVLKPWMQLDVYSGDKFSATQRAETAVANLFGFCGRHGNTDFELITAQRSRLIKCEDGTWKAPIDIRFTCRRV